MRNLKNIEKYVFRLDLWATAGTANLKISKVCVHHQNNHVLSTNNRHPGHCSCSLIFKIGYFWAILSHFTVCGLL